MTIHCNTCKATLSVESSSEETLRAFGWTRRATPASMMRYARNRKGKLDLQYVCVSCRIEEIPVAA